MSPCLQVQALGSPSCSKPLSGALHLHSLDKNYPKSRTLLFSPRRVKCQYSLHMALSGWRIHMSFDVSTVLRTRLRFVPPAPKSSQSKKKPLSVIRRLHTGIVPQSGHHEDRGKVLNRVTRPVFQRWRCLSYRVISKERKEKAMLTQNRSEVQSRVNLPSVQVSQGKN